MRLTNITLLFIMSSLMLGCGGGGDGDSTTAEPVVSKAAVVESTAVVSNAVEPELIINIVGESSSTLEPVVPAAAVVESPIVMSNEVEPKLAINIVKGSSSNANPVVSKAVVIESPVVASNLAEPKSVIDIVGESSFTLEPVVSAAAVVESPVVASNLAEPKPVIDIVGESSFTFEPVVSAAAVVESPVIVSNLAEPKLVIDESSSTLEPVVESPIVVSNEVEPKLAINIVKPDPNAIYESTADLIASKSFLIEQEYELAISYKNDDNRNAYLSVCTDFSEGEGGIKVNYNSCLLRTPIESDYAGTLTVANDNDRLVMAIWYFDDTKNPRYTIWENGGDDKNTRTFDVQ